jgi:hypothetical protein
MQVLIAIYERLAQHLDSHLVVSFTNDASVNLI